MEQKDLIKELRANGLKSGDCVYDESADEIERLQKAWDSCFRQMMLNEGTRKDVLLKACYDILKKCDNGPYVKNVIEETAFYDDTDCDGLCLMTDIGLELGIL